MGPKKYGYCPNVQVEDTCKVLGRGFNLKCAVGATEGVTDNGVTAWFTMFYGFQSKLMTDLKSMAIVPMHEWKVPLKYWAWCKPGWGTK